MTKEDAVAIVSEIRSDYNFFDKNEQKEYHALSMAIEALQEQATLDDVSNAYENGYKQGKFETLQWIPCSERKPKQQQPVIITDEGDVLTGYINSLNEWMDFYGNRLKGVIAWMPLPEPYKENES